LRWKSLRLEAAGLPVGSSKGAEAQHRTAEEQLLKKAIGLGAVHLRQGDRAPLHRVLQAAALGVLGQADQAGLQMLGMGLVQVAVLGGEGKGGGPELPGLVLLQAAAQGIGFADVDPIGAAFRIRTREHIDARAFGLRALGELLELGARHHKADAAPVRFLHDAHAFRLAGGHEQAQGEGAGGGHRVGWNG
jgi:hypothetical protein